MNEELLPAVLKVVEGESKRRAVLTPVHVQSRQLMTRLQDIGKTVYQTNYTGGYDNCIARPESYKMHHGFLAPECH